MLSTLPVINLPHTTGLYEKTMQNCCIWILILGFLFAFGMCLATGANDCANSFGTSVGAKVLTIRSACILATVFETLGCILLGYKVSDTIRKNIFELTMYNNCEKELMLGCLSSLAGSAVWQTLATFFKMPVSGTHSIIGSTLGFSLVARGFVGIKWWTLGRIALSWIISPLLSGILSSLFYLGIVWLILKAKNPIKSGLSYLPFIYGLTIFVNIFSIIFDGPKILKLDNLPIWISFTASLVISLIVILLIRIFLVPWLKRKLTGANNKLSTEHHISLSKEKSPAAEIDNPFKTNAEVHNPSSINGSTFSPTLRTRMPGEEMQREENEKDDDTRNRKIFFILQTDSQNGKYLNNGTIKRKSLKNLLTKMCHIKDTAVSPIFILLQILTAVFGSFAHGGNDVSNAIGPLVSMWLTYNNGNVDQSSETPVYLLLFGGFGISLGLCLWGRKVIETIGKNLTEVTPSSGFAIEIGAASTVLLASKIGLPISTTHCKVGSVVFVGMIRSPKSVHWSLFKNIIIAWLVTVPASALFSAAVMILLRSLVL